MEDMVAMQEDSDLLYPWNRATGAMEQGYCPVSTIDTAEVPFMGPYLDPNVTTFESRRNFSKPFRLPSQPSSSHITIHEFQQRQQSPRLAPSPDVDSHILRRKNSLRHLAGDEGASVAVEAPLHPPAPLIVSSQPLPAPSTPQHHPAVTSPSLSSTGTTLQSTPTQTPPAYLPTNNQRRRGIDVDELVGLKVRTDRYFPHIKQAKRLPRRAVDNTWCVYAAVIRECDEADVQPVAGVHLVESKLEASGRIARPERRGLARRDRSVRFAGVWSESDLDSEKNTSGEEKDTTRDSTYTLSKFKFPTPPGYNWAGTFGHLSEPTPPTSPTVLHYRGASFDLVNPHASLLLGTKDIETPAEIDGLLDDYFHSADDLAMPYDEFTGEMSSSPASAAPEGSRRGRTLFPDANSAHRHIMRRPFPEPVASGLKCQESPLAHRALHSHDARATPDTHPLEGDLGAMPLEHVPETAIVQGQASQRSSSAYPRSIYSNPFDLNVSDDEGLEDYTNGRIDAIVGSSHHVLPHTDGTGEKDIQAGGDVSEDEGANLQAETHEDSGRDVTLHRILDHYRRSDPSGPSDKTPLHEQHVSPFTYTSEQPQRPKPRLFHPVTQTGGKYTATVRLHGPPTLPPPMPYGHPENFQDGSDLPTSDLGTYGLTGELLPTTPDDRGTPGTRPSACPYLTQGTTLPILPAEYRGASFDEDKENVPPGDALSDIDFAEQDIPVTWSNEDIPVRVRQATLGCQDSFAGPDNDEHDWEDELGSMSNLNGAPNRFSHVTQASYADTSDHDSDHDRTSFGASRDPTVSVRPPSRSLVDFAGASGTRHAMTGQLNSPFLSALAALTSTELFQSAKSLLLRKVLSTTKQNDDNEDNLTVDPSQNSSRRDKDDFMQDEMKLETIRQLNPEVFEQAVREVADEVEQEKCGTSESSRRNAMENSRPRTHIPGSYDPSSSFEKAKQMIASRQSGGSQSPTSSTRPLLSGRGGRGGLGFSETRGTFTTQADEDDSTPSFTPAFGKTRRIPIRGRYIPNPGTGTLSFTPSRSRSRDRRVQSPSFVNIPLDGDNRYEMGRIHRIGDGARAAIDSQTSLQPLILTRTTTRRANFDPGHCLTDSELADRERNWSDNPRYGGVTGNVALNIAVRGLEEGRALITPAQAANAETLKEQRDISTRYYLYFMFCPISAAIFGFGYADGIARKVSQGRVSEMHAEDKRHALTVALPLGMIAWGLIGLTMLIVWAVLHH